MPEPKDGIRQMNMAALCPACMNMEFNDLVDFGVVPRSGIFTTEPNRAHESINLSFVFCPKCGLIMQKGIKARTIDYTFVNRRTFHRLPPYTEQIIEWLHNENVTKNDLIVEVGSNDGAFLDLLGQEQYLNTFGIEPSLICANICRSKGLVMETVHLNQKEAGQVRGKYGLAKAVICRHTLEHVPDPLDLILAMKNLLDADGVLVLEVPSAYGIIWETRGYELWDEHLTMFMPKNLILLLQRAGLHVDQIIVNSFVGAQNILLMASTIQKSKSINVIDDLEGNIRACSGFSDRWHVLRGQLASDLAKVSGPIGCFGASHPQSNLINFTGVGHMIDYLIDDDVVKIGKYLPIPNNVPIISSEQAIRDVNGGILMSVPREACEVQSAEGGTGQRLATSPERNSAFREVTN